MFAQNRFERGAAMPFIIVIIAVAVLGVVYFAAVQKPGEDAATQKEGEAMMKEKETGAMMDKTGTGTGETMMKDESVMMMKYAGAMLAGKSAPLLDFNKADYDWAVKSDKLIVIYFYANWCPVCKAEFPVMQKAFDELTTDKAIGFRVNYNDSDTDDNEKNLAREFGVAYQHTKVFVKNGQRILKSPEGWDDKRYDMEISKALSQ